jgi:hypothetical protein
LGLQPLPKNKSHYSLSHLNRIGSAHI